MHVKGLSRKKSVNDENKSTLKENQHVTAAEVGRTEQVHVNLSTQEVLFDGTSVDGVVDLSVKKAVDDGLVTNAITNENENSNGVLRESTNLTENNQLPHGNSRDKKRRFQDDPELFENENHIDLCNYTEGADTIVWKKKCIELETKIKMFEEHYMPRPINPAVIQYFVDFGNTLSSEQKYIHPSNNEQFTKALNTIGISENDLQNFKVKTPTALARSLIKFKYPHPDPCAGFSQVDKSVIFAVIECVRYRFPFATTSDNELRRAMNNYFSSFT